MKKLHLICNAHIDAIWQWQFDEGISAAISTFNQAAKLCDEFDYIFCHNEAILYEAIEKYEPKLFAKIQDLVALGKWKIMGGWYLQPDCNMPSGESIVRQIQVGRKYFYDKFGVTPTVAINFDSFGHSVGLVQILKKTAYNGYMICRPNDKQINYPSTFFDWVGLDGSVITVAHAKTYNSAMGQATEKIEQIIEQNDNDIDYVLWGVGNHGGGASKKDLADIAKMIDCAEFSIEHSYPEKLFSEVASKGVISTSLNPCMPGCYSTMSKIKKLHRRLENSLFDTEKMMSSACLQGDFTYDKTKLCEAEKMLLLSQFHDILPGTCIEKGEENGLRALNRGLDITAELRSSALFFLLRNENKAKNGEYPVFAFNFQPYEYTTLIEVEFQLADQNWTDKWARVIVKDGETILDCQQIKEDSTLTLDWRKKIVFLACLKPLQLNHFSIFVEFEEKQINTFGDINFNANNIIANFSSGNLCGLSMFDEQILSNEIKLVMYDDSADPWAMSDSELTQLGSNPRDFLPLDKNNNLCYSGISDTTLPACRIIEDGKILKRIETVVGLDNSKARLQYTFYYGLPYVDLDIDLDFFEKNKLIRLNIPVFGNKIFGDTMFGIEAKQNNGTECVFQQLFGVELHDDICFGVVNNCVYSGRFSGNSMEITLLRGAGYCFHPINARQLYPNDRYLPRIDTGANKFSFRFCLGKKAELAYYASQFNSPPYTINAFPLDSKTTKNSSLVVSNTDIILTAFKQNDNGDYIIRLFNPSNEKTSSDIIYKNIKSSIVFGAYEVVSIKFDGKFSILKNMEV